MKINKGKRKKEKKKRGKNQEDQENKHIPQLVSLNKSLQLSIVLMGNLYLKILFQIYY